MSLMRKMIIFPIVLAAAFCLFAEEARQNSPLKGSLLGEVINDNGDPACQARVLLRGHGFEADYLTDEQGFFSALSLPLGVYRIMLASSAPSRAEMKEVAIHLGKQTRATLVIGGDNKPDRSDGRVSGPFYLRDSQGRIAHQEIMIEDKLFSTKYVYDAQGRLISMADNMNQTWRFDYAPSGNIQKVSRGDKQYLDHLPIS